MLSYAAPIAALAAVAAANAGPWNQTTMATSSWNPTGIWCSTTTTDIVTSKFTTYCSEPTTVTYGTKTYTVSSATTLTVTDCPCTLKKTITTTPAPVTVTQVQTAVTTVCPSPTTLTIPCGSGPAKTITVSSATTLTHTDCPGGCHVPVTAQSMPPAKTITAVVSSYTTYCPAPTTWTYGPSSAPITVPVTAPTTITISSCPGGCTVTCPVSQVIPPPAAMTPVASTGPVAPPAMGNGTSPAKPSTSVVPYTAGAGKVMAGGSLMAAVAAVAFFL